MMIRSLNNEEYCNTLSNHVYTLVQMWDDMVSEKRIKKLNKCFYDDLPSEYNLIIDNDILIIGNYVLTENDRSHVTIDKVVSISGDSADGKAVIESYIYRFDQSFKYLLNNGGDVIKR